MNDQIVSLIRTWVPLAIGWGASRLLAAGIDIDETALTTALVPAITAAYYGLARLLEKLHPFFGWLLGVPKQPTY